MAKNKNFEEMTGKINEGLENEKKIAGEIIEDLKTKNFGNLKDFVIYMFQDGSEEKAKETYGDEFTKHWLKVMNLPEDEKKGVMRLIVEAI